jgi:hypothetical protein
MSFGSGCAYPGLGSGPWVQVLFSHRLIPEIQYPFFADIQV